MSFYRKTLSATRDLTCKLVCRKNCSGGWQRYTQLGVWQKNVYRNNNSDSWQECIPGYIELILLGVHSNH